MELILQKFSAWPDSPVVVEHSALAKDSMTRPANDQPLAGEVLQETDVPVRAGFHGNVDIDAGPTDNP